MFRAYALDLDQIGSLIENEPVKSIYDNVDREKINSSLKKFLKANVTCLNGEKLIEIFFPSKCCPVFLSHSGLDKSRVEQFAQWLKKNFEIVKLVTGSLIACHRLAAAVAGPGGLTGSTLVDGRYTYREVSDTVPLSPESKTFIWPLCT